MKKYQIVKIKRLFGIYNGKIVLEEIIYKQNPEEFLNDDNAYISNLRNSTKKIKLFDVSSKTEEEIHQDVYKSMEDIQYENGKIYFVAYKAQKIEYLDLDTKQKQILCDLPQSDVILNGIYDNKLQYCYYNKDTSKVDKAYYIDLETKENKEIKLFDKNGYLVKILAENKEYYFVRKGYELGAEYTTWAGTKQQNIEKTNYALIKKEDYWNSTPKYIDIKNTQKEQGEKTMLEIIDLSKSYKEKKVLDNINLKLENGLYGLLRTKWSRKEYINEYHNR